MLDKIKSEKTLILYTPFVLAICLAYFSIYPLSSRVSLYLIPIFILFIVQIIDYVNFRNKIVNYLLYSVIIFLGGFFVITNSVFNIWLKNIEYNKNV